MTKQTALGDSFFVGSFDLSGDIGALSSAQSSRAVIDVSSIVQGAMDRLLGRADGSIAFNAFFDNAAGQSHAALKTLGTAAGTVITIASFFHTSVVGGDAASLASDLQSYDIAVGADQSIAVTGMAQAASGRPLEWGQMLTTGKQTLASTGAGSAYDGIAASSFGGGAYLHVFSMASGTATVAVQHSTTGTSSWSDVGGLVFTAATGATFERKITTAITTTVNRYRRVNVTGTFSNLVFAVNHVIYPTSQT